MGGIKMKQRYDSYKPSGIDWIGEIPEHWQRTRIKYNIIYLVVLQVFGARIQKVMRMILFVLE